MRSDSIYMKDYYTKKHHLCSITREGIEKKMNSTLEYKNYFTYSTRKDYLTRLIKLK